MRPEGLRTSDGVRGEMGPEGERTNAGGGALALLVVWDGVKDARRENCCEVGVCAPLRLPVPPLRGEVMPDVEPTRASVLRCAAADVAVAVVLFVLFVLVLDELVRDGDVERELVWLVCCRLIVVEFEVLTRELVALVWVGAARGVVAEEPVANE